uniref:Protein FAR1-RELATED SEQUENCE n=1 Tax=Lactuca sativa TaxID=4236 RepID=A0A9R1XHJ1_LACSA|nr:hypothetical protein LSAT_V11C400166620 [Lactuca sativa]
MEKRILVLIFCSGTCVFVQIMMFETKATDEAIESHINENVDTNDFKTTYDSEEVNDFDMNIKFDEDKDNFERILRKNFNTLDNAYTFYNNYSFLHGFGIRKDDTKMVSNSQKKNDSSGNEKKHRRDVKMDAKQSFRITIQKDVKWLRKELYGLIKHSQDKTLVDSDKQRDAYTKFRDIILFDVAYMINKFKMSFAPLIGVNYHGQSKVFHGAFLENKKEETFNKYPKAIITDQDKAMGNAIKKNTFNRIFPVTMIFKKSYKEWVNSDTTKQFEIAWEVIRSKYKLENNV